MKKTLTVNLGGTVYHIDELLDNYLNNLRYHFRKEEGAEEMVRDIEIRIAEIFNEYIRSGQQVITLENVEEVIARMGKPEDWETGESETSSTASAPHRRKKSNANCSVTRTTVFWVVCFPDCPIISGWM